MRVHPALRWRRAAIRLGFAIGCFILYLVAPLRAAIPKIFFDPGSEVWRLVGASPQPLALLQGVLLRLDANRLETQLTLLEQADVHAVLIELPDLPEAAVWQKAIELLEQKRFLYWFLFSPFDERRYVRGWTIQPERYRLRPNPQGTYNLRFPGAHQALLIVADRNDASIKRELTLEVREDKALLAAGGDPATEVLLFYPRGVSPLPNLWERWDDFRDRLFALLKRSPPGKGFQGWVNLLPLLSNEDARAVIPDSSLFRLEWEAFLKERYKEPADLNRAWRTESELKSLSEAAKAVPLWRLKRGVPYLWLPGSKPVRVDPSRSTFWSDYFAYLDSQLVNLARTCQRALQEVHGSKPVYTLWLPPEDQPLGSLSRRTQPLEEGLAVWLLPEAREAWDYQLLNALQVSRSLGRQQLMAIVSTIPDQTEAANLFLAKLRSMGYTLIFWQIPVEQLQSIPWLTGFRSADQGLQPPELLPFPESAWTPAEIERLPDGRWWVPVAGMPGEPLRWGRKVAGYWLASGDGSLQLCLWSIKGRQPLTVRVPNNSSLSAFSTDGQPVELRTKGDRLTLTLTEVPLVLQGFRSMPICESVVEEWRERFAHLEQLAKQRGRDLSVARFLFRQAYSSWKRDPYGGFEALLRAIQEAERLLRPYLWLEAESASEHSFGTVRDAPAASGKATLWLNSPLAPSSEGYFARYPLSILEEGDYVLWLASPDRKAPVEWSLISGIESDSTPIAQGRLSDPESEPVAGRYGGRFLWLRLGVVHLKPGPFTLTLRLPTPVGGWYRAEWDAILIAPPTIKPSDREPPDFE
ncbi:MAG: hypothetical protein ABIN58_09940 [candidate division WOR-3 bacterium]